MGVIRLEGNELAQPPFHDVDAADALGGEGGLVEQVDVFRFGAQSAVQHLEGVVIAVGVTQQLGFDQHILNAICRRLTGDPL